MSPIEAALVLIPLGVVAGVMGSGGGITSLVSYPALLAVGVPPLPANVANIVAAAAIAPGSALTSRLELAGTRPILARLLPVAVMGSVAGAVLLLLTPPGLFARVVPYLVAGGSLVLLLQPMLSRLRLESPVGVTALAPLVGAISIYGGYFGAGSGVMMLAVLLFYDSRIPPANAIKNVLVGATCAAAAVLLVLTGPVRWTAVIPLAAGVLAGSAVGPIVVRHLPAGVVRCTAAGLGFFLAGYLWLQPG